MSIKLIKPEPGFGQAQVALAMLAGIPVAEAAEAIGENLTASVGQIIDALSKLKIKHTPRKMINRGKSMPPSDALIWIGSDKEGRVDRMGVYAGGLIYDPLLQSPVQQPSRSRILAYLRVEIPESGDEGQASQGETAKERFERYERYRNGAEGFILWAEEHIRIRVIMPGTMVPVWTLLGELPDTPDPITGRSYKQFWEKQKKVVRRALALKGGKFKHRLIVLCWPRGEGKTYLVCFIQMWKFFCWPNQEIMLCANSKDQTKFVQYGIIRKTIENSPKLLRLVGTKNIQEKEIRITDRSGNVVSFIRSMSNFTGIVSNITGYAFSELFQLKDHEFFQQIDGSIRNIPNAFGVIDSTVSPKDHILYRLYQSFQKNEDETLFFDYRYSKTGDYRDYWHPEQSQEQLDSYRVKFILGGFERYFMNLWSAGAEVVFTREQVDAVGYMGCDGSAESHGPLIEMLERRNHLVDQVEFLSSEGADMKSRSMLIGEVDRRLWPVDAVYTLDHHSSGIVMATAGALEALGELFDTNWAILASVDRADPMKSGRTGARTLLTTVAKGLAGSASRGGNVSATSDAKSNAMGLNYIYFLLCLGVIADHSLDSIKGVLSEAASEFGGIDAIGVERWGMWDLKPWADDEGIDLEAWMPSYSVHQRAMFGELYILVDSGRFKSPRVNVPGSKLDDILREEMRRFDHDPDAKKFGSPEKKNKHGVQDDAVYSLASAIYGGRLKTVFDFNPRGRQMFWGAMQHPSGLLGNYGAS